MDEVTAVPSHSVYSTTFSVPWRYADRSPIGEAVAALHGCTDSVQREFWAGLADSLRGREDYSPTAEDAYEDQQASRRLAAEQVPTVQSVVYYVLFADRVKIGTTSDLKTRLLVVPHDQLLATEAGSYDVERARHIEFREYRITREWFRYEGRLKQHIATLTCA